MPPPIIQDTLITEVVKLQRMVRKLETRKTALAKNETARIINSRDQGSGAENYVLEPLYSLATGLVLPKMPTTVHELLSLEGEDILAIFSALEIQVELIGTPALGWGRMDLQNNKIRLALQLGIPAGPMWFERLPGWVEGRAEPEESYTGNMKPGS